MIISILTFFSGKQQICSNKECANPIEYNDDNDEFDASMHVGDENTGGGCCKNDSGGGSCLDLVDELPFEEDDVYISSSCSISISSSAGGDNDHTLSSHQITVPVYVEPAPPEIRLPPTHNDDPPASDSHLSVGGMYGGVDLEAGSADIVGLLLQGDHRRPRISHQVKDF